MKRGALLILLILMLLGTAAAEEVRTLPMDLSPGMPLRAENYVDENTYIDPTIEMHVTSGTEDETSWWMADVTIQHPSQLRTMPAYSFTSNVTLQGKRLSSRANAVLAVNGDYFSLEVHVKGSYVLRQGTLYSQPVAGADGYPAH